MRALVKLLLLVVWVFGAVIAKGFWSTFFAFFVPFWAWYLSAETALIHWGAL
ncbi:hypothetical protein D3C71_276990 [compost metagenome]